MFAAFASQNPLAPDELIFRIARLHRGKLPPRSDHRLKNDKSETGGQNVQFVCRFGDDGVATP
jgi:hypothetical protein